MPMFIVNTNVAKSDVPAGLLTEATEELARAMEKPAQYIAVHINPDQMMMFGGKGDPCALCSLHSIGKIGSAYNKQYSKLLCGLLSKHLGISPDRGQVIALSQKTSITHHFSIYDIFLKSAVFEIMTIFENNLRDHQMELAHKEEEIVQLKIKLQEAEVKQRDAKCGGERGAEVDSTQVNETQRAPEDVECLNAPGQTSDVPEIDFEVPDDWCAPLSCETTKKQEEGTCPSVRLRPLYIPLWPVPVFKEEHLMAARRCHSRGVNSCSRIIVPQLPVEAEHRGKQRCQSLFRVKTSLNRSRMEAVRSAFHAQLATVMDSLLAAAVCEIAKIFEGSLCEQQAELAQKTEEISLLRSKLEKAERRREEAEGEGWSGRGRGDVTRRQRGQLEAADPHRISVGKDVSAHSDPAEELGQSLGGLKEEVTGQDGASVKHERAGSRPTLGSVAVQTSEGSLAAVDQRQIDNLSATQAKAKCVEMKVHQFSFFPLISLKCRIFLLPLISLHWDQGSRSADHRRLQDQASSPFLSISQSGRCSPRPDPSLAQPGEWLPGLDTTRGGVSSLENLRADGTSCSGPASSSAGTDAPCFRPGFGSDETSNEDDDSSFPFLDQEPENQNSIQNSVQGQAAGQRGARQVQPQAPSGESPWRPRDERSGRGPINHTRRVTTLGNRDPLRPQSNSQSLTLRHTNTLSHPAAPGGGNGRPYTCPYCTKCFTYPSHQRRHLLRHTGVRLHPCQFCDKSFLTPSELTVHTRTHTGERPFGCAQCENPHQDSTSSPHLSIVSSPSLNKIKRSRRNGESPKFFIISTEGDDVRTVQPEELRPSCPPLSTLESSPRMLSPIQVLCSDITTLSLEPEPFASYTEADIISTVEFNHTGELLATGDKGGRVVIFQREPESKTEPFSQGEYNVYSTFQSHEPEFDYLKSLEIEEKINKIRWLPQQNAAHFLLSTNDKTIKLWKVSERDKRPEGYNLKDEEGRIKDISTVTSLQVPVLKPMDLMVEVSPRRVFANAHTYHVNSISVNSDYETYMSADDLRINLWHLDITDRSFNIVDIKPANMEDLTEVITAAEFHPHHCNLFVYSSSKGTLRLCDMREAALCDKHSKLFEEPEDPSARSFFSEIISSVSDVKFSHSGRYLLTRDYLTAKVWDLNMESKPLETYQVHDYLRSKLCSLYENDCIFDKFECAWNGSDSVIMTGAYNNFFRMFDRNTKRDVTLEASRESSKPRAVLKPRRVCAAGGKRRKDDISVDSLDFTKKILHTAWHPSENIIAIAATNNLYIFQDKLNSEMH
ncbi:hypothetical protein L3Q82_020563 [Scortum barcoo]|uniref:Uncharacterized protein n=1 Tax=Scortum barcoo TaxID=214431 RepID=A0ACB8VB39_9TELE|nr:hypothetical protein L3Q82_020563 [Scortum barcoo]